MAAVMQVRIMDMTGRSVLSDTKRVQGNGLLAVETQLPPGTYLVRLHSLGEEAVRRFVVR